MIFISGTDTGCGKTTVGRAIAAALAARGLRVATFKPCETGCRVDERGRRVAEDAEALSRAARNGLPDELACPIRLLLPASPERAAEEEGLSLTTETIIEAWKRAKTFAQNEGGTPRASERRDLISETGSEAEFGLVEGAGGLLVPVTPKLMMVDLPALLDLPVLLVARDALGTVNHTLLSIEAIRRRHLRLVGVVFSSPSAESGSESLRNIEAIARHGQFEVLGLLPHLVGADDDELARAAEAHLHLDRLLELARRKRC
jgi:dethiobiotin synthetase